MDVALLTDALGTLEQDHQLVQDRVQALKEMVAVLTGAEDIDAPRVFGRLRELDNYFVTQFATHMDEEEKTLFVLLEQFPPEGVALVERLRQEHTELRGKLDDFTSCLTVALDLQDRPPRAVLRDLMIATWDLWEFLDEHAHAETQGIHDCLKRHLSAAR